MRPLRQRLFTNETERAHPVHHEAYRLFGLIAAVLSPALGAIYYFTDPAATDPLWARLAMALLALMVVTLSYMNNRVQGAFIGLMRLYFYLFTAYCIGLTALNGFATNYALGLLFAVTAIGIAFSFSLGRIRPLTYYLAFAVLLTGGSFFSTPAPEASPVILLLCLVSVGLVTYVVARSKLRAEKELERSARRYKTLLSEANDAIFIADLQTSALIEANQKAQELSGRSLKELRQITLGELFPARRRERYVRLLRDHVRQGTALSEELRLEQQGSGGLVPVDVSASIIDVEGEKLIQALFRDLTDSVRFEAEKEARKRAEELLRLKTNFLNNMSHEIRTPLASILGYAEVLIEEIEGEPKRFAETITTSAERLQRTLTSVLKLAELESGEVTLRREAVNVAEEAEDVASMFRQLARKKNLDLRLRARTAYVHVDRTCLSRILNNLIGNGIKFTREGHVEVAIEVEADTVHLRIADTGQGINEEFLGQVFDEFKQESTGLTRSHEGTGLGLAITKRLTELMGGTIGVESEREKGSCFTVTFPRFFPKNGTEQDDQEEMYTFEPRVVGKRLLIVEDNPNMSSLLERRLGTYHEVYLASQPREALHLVQEGPFDAFVLDINLGASRDGVDLLEALRALPSYGRTPALALTAYAMPGDRERYLEQGFSAYLEKPFTTARLLETVDRLLGPSSLKAARGEKPAKAAD